MIERHETDYAWNGDVALAYQVIGDGPLDIVYLQGFMSNVDVNWESPYLARFLSGLAGLGRLIMTDRRGWGCSDRFSPTDVAPIETLTDDLLVVMDAVGSERVAFVSSDDATPTVMMLAATHPERCVGLALIDPEFVEMATAETPWLPDERDWEHMLDVIHNDWGTSRWHPMSDPSEQTWYARYQRPSVTPGSLVGELRRYKRDRDIGAILPSIRVPTLVFSSTAVGGVGSPENSRYIADRIPGARLVEIDRPADEIDFFHWYGRAPAILREVGAFMSEVREEQRSLDRVLATVLFTDIVDSTATATTMGDSKWRALLEEHDRIAKQIIARFRGTYVKGTGDGLLATFDGPARGVRCAQAIVQAMEPLGIEIRAGLHTGEIEYGGQDLAGVGVHIGARVGAMAGASEVWVSSTVKDLVVGSGLAFEDAGEHELKGVPDRWHVYRVVHP